MARRAMLMHSRTARCIATVLVSCFVLATADRRLETGERKQETRKSRNEDWKQETRRMHDWFCALPGKAEYFPCRRHEAMVQHGAFDRDNEIHVDFEAARANREKLDAVYKEIDKEMDRELEGKQHAEMHDDYCKDPGLFPYKYPASFRFCQGWWDWKAKRQEEQNKDEA